MTSNDRTPEIMNLPMVFAPNHQSIYRNGRFQPIVPDPPTLPVFLEWLRQARRIGHYRVQRPIETHEVNRPDSDIIWAWPPTPRMWSRTGDRTQMMGNFIGLEANHRPHPLAEATLDRARKWLIERYRLLDADHTPEPILAGSGGRLTCFRCGITVRSDRTHHGIDI